MLNERFNPTIKIRLAWFKISIVLSKFFLTGL